MDVWLRVRSPLRGTPRFVGLRMRLLGSRPALSSFWIASARPSRCRFTRIASSRLARVASRSSRSLLLLGVASGRRMFRRAALGRRMSGHRDMFPRQAPCSLHRTAVVCPFHSIARPGPPRVVSRAMGGFLRSIPVCGTWARCRPCHGNLVSPPPPWRWVTPCGHRRFPSGRSSFSRSFPLVPVRRCLARALGYGDIPCCRAVLCWPLRPRLVESSLSLG